jgi:hypothetical protein
MGEMPDYSADTVLKVNNLIGENGCPMFAVIKCKEGVCFVVCKLLHFYTISNKKSFKIGVKTRFDSTDYDQMTHMNAAVIAYGRRLGVDLESKNFDTWGRYHVLLPVAGKWCSTPVRKLLISREVRRGLDIFDETKIEFSPAIEKYNHIKRNNKPMFIVDVVTDATEDSDATTRKRKRVGKSSAAAAGSSDVAPPLNVCAGNLKFAPTQAQLNRFRDLHMAAILLKQGQKRSTFEEDMQSLVQQYPHTSKLCDLLDIDSGEAHALMCFAQSLPKTSRP